mgnify:CR=1 FL=1
MAVALTAPHALAAAGLLFYPAVVSTSLVGGAALVLAPMGAVRGALFGAEHLMVPAAGNVFADRLRAQQLDWTTLDEGARTLRARAEEFDISASLLSTTSGGVLARGAVGLFMPSTESLLEHIAAETSAASENVISGGVDSSDFLSLAKAATNGMIAGQITGARDKVTVGALGLSAVLVVGAIVVDHLTHAAVQKKETALQSVKDKVQSVKIKVQSAKDLAEEGRSAAVRVGQNQMQSAKDIAEDSRSTVSRAGQVAQSKWQNWKTRISSGRKGEEGTRSPPADSS